MHLVNIVLNLLPFSWGKANAFVHRRERNSIVSPIAHNFVYYVVVINVVNTFDFLAVGLIADTLMAWVIYDAYNNLRLFRHPVTRREDNETKTYQ